MFCSLSLSSPPPPPQTLSPPISLPLQSSVMADKALDELSRANEELRVDIDKWKEAKDREINSLMRKVADDHINFHQQVSLAS